MDFTPLARFVDSLIDYGIPSADILVKQGHKTLFAHRAGWKDMENRIPLQGDERYFMYSCSKVITCTAAMQLFEQGYFLLNDPVSKFIPEFADIKVKEADGSLRKPAVPVQMKHLFSMSAGLDYNLRSDAILEVKKKTGGLCPTVEVAKAIASGPISFDPGTRWQYSLCHDVLAAVVEIISGERFSDYVTNHIFKPLGMTRSCFHADAIPESEFACQYQMNEKTRKVTPVPLKASYILGSEYDSGGAGIISTVHDYSLFVDAMACGGVGSSGARILSPAAISLMATNQLNDAQLADMHTWIQMVGYGYGLGVRTMMDRTQGSLSPVGEFGWGGAAGSYVVIDPINHLSIFYAQHMLNNQEPYVHPRLRNITYSCL